MRLSREIFREILRQHRRAIISHASREVPLRVLDEGLPNYHARVLWRLQVSLDSFAIDPIRWTV